MGCALAGWLSCFGASSCTLKGCGFNSWSGHIARLRVPSLAHVHVIPGLGAYGRQAVDVSLSHQYLCLCLSLLPTLSLQKQWKKCSQVMT